MHGSSDLFGGQLFDEQVCNSSQIESDVCSDNLISGHIIGVSTDSMYKRTFFRKVHDKLFFNQRMSDVINTVIVRSMVNDTSIDSYFYIYGKILGGISQLKVGGYVYGKGKYDSGNRFMVNELKCDSVNITTQIEKDDVLLVLSPLFVLLIGFLVSMFFSGYNTSGEYASVILKFVVSFMACFAGVGKFLRSKFRYILSFGKRMKIGGLVSLIGSLLITSVLA